MTGPEHYEAAERLLADAERHNTEHPGDMRIAEICAYTAQVHATLALAAGHGVGPSEERPSQKRYRISEDHLQQVANVYGEAAYAGEPPTRAVANHFDVPHSTAAKWVGRARKQHFLNTIEGGAR